MDKKEIATIALILALAFMLRVQPMLFGAISEPDSYFHLRMSELVVAEQGVPEYDALSMGGRDYSYAPLFHMMLAFFALVSGLNLAFLIVLMPAIYGSAAVLLVYALSKRIFSSNSIATFSAFAIAIMPMHLMRTSSAYVRPDALALLIVPAVIYLFYIRRTKIAALLSAGLVLLHPLSTLFLLLFLLLWAIASKMPSLARSDADAFARFPAKAAFLTVLLTVAVFLVWLFSLPYPPLQYISNVSFESVELSKLLVLHIFVFFTFSWLFFLIALFKSKSVFAKFWFLYAFAFAIFGLRLGIFMSIPAALLAGFGIEFAWEKLKPYSKVFVLLLFLLAAITVLSRIGMNEAFVSPAEQGAMFWIDTKTPQSAVIGAVWDRGHPLAYLANRKVVMDGYFEFAPGLEERNEAIKEIITTSDCAKIEENSQKFGMDYFFIPKAGLSDRSYKNGILEANDCPQLASVFASDGARIFAFG